MLAQPCKSLVMEVVDPTSSVWPQWEDWMDGRVFSASGLFPRVHIQDALNFYVSIGVGRLSCSQHGVDLIFLNDAHITVGSYTMRADPSRKRINTADKVRHCY